MLLGYWVWYRLPNVRCIFGDGAVARKSSGACYVQNRFVRPCARIGIQRTEPFMCLAIRRKVCQVHVVIAERQESVTQRIEYSWLVAAEVIRENEVKSGSSLRLIFIMPVRTVPGAAVLNLFYGQTEQEHVLLPRLLRHFDGRAIARSDG